MAYSPTHLHGPARVGRVAESHRTRLDKLLRRVQQVRNVFPSRTHQHLLDAVGSQEVQATAHMETVPRLVARTHRKGARTLRALGMDAHVPVERMRRAE